MAKRWQKRVAKARQAYFKWHDRHVLADIRYTAGGNAWSRSVQEVQKVFPGTSSWLMSCSASEGGWGRWVGYGGVAYYEGYRGVGGWLQFMPGTFSGFVRHAIAYAQEREFVVPESAWSWLSPLGQALAGGWGITHGQGGHWAGAGC